MFKVNFADCKVPVSRNSDNVPKYKSLVNSSNPTLAICTLKDYKECRKRGPILEHDRKKPSYKLMEPILENKI